MTLHDDLIENLLDQIKVLKGQVRYAPSPVRLQQNAKSVLDEFRNAIDGWRSSPVNTCESCKEKIKIKLNTPLNVFNVVSYTPGDTFPLEPPPEVLYVQEKE